MSTIVCKKVRKNLNRKEVTNVEELDIIRERIKKHRLSFVWLINQLSMRGIETDKTEVSSIFAGTRKGAKADSIIQCSTEILDDYEHGMSFVHSNE